MFTFGICDDDANTREIIKNVCNHYMFQNDLEYCFREFSSGDQCLEEVSQDASYILDLLFLDIELPGMDGLKTRDILVESKNVKRIVFVSSHKENVIDAFGLKTVGFVPKPIEKEQLQKKIDLVVREFRNKKVLNLSMSATGTKTYLLEDIFYMEAEGNYTRIYRNTTEENAEYELISMKIGDIEKKCNGGQLLRVHKSFLVNPDFIKNIKDKVIMKEGIEIPIGRKYKNEVKAFYLEYILNKARERM